MIKSVVAIIVASLFYMYNLRVIIHFTIYELGKNICFPMVNCNSSGPI